MEPKRIRIEPEPDRGDGSSFTEIEDKNGNYYDAYDPAIVEAIAIADAAREAGLVKDGKLMPMIGKLQVTADNCVILDREVAIHLPLVNGAVYTASAGCAARMHQWYANREAAMEASKAESSARSAAKAAAKGATDAQG